MHWWGFFHHVAFWNYFNFIGNSMLFLVPESWNSGVQTAGTCWAVGNGLQGQTVRRASWDGVWWAGIATWEEPEPTEENTEQHFSHGIEANAFLFYVSHELRKFVRSVPRVWWCLLTCYGVVNGSPAHHFTCFVTYFLVSISAVDLANHFLKFFQYSWHEGNSTRSLMPKFGSFLKVFHCPIFFLEDGLH